MVNFEQVNVSLVIRENTVRFSIWIDYTYILNWLVNNIVQVTYFCYLTLDDSSI